MGAMFTGLEMRSQAVLKMSFANSNPFFPGLRVLARNPALCEGYLSKGRKRTAPDRNGPEAIELIKNSGDMGIVNRGPGRGWQRWMKTLLERFRN
jgi:hypothetical protein